MKFRINEKRMGGAFDIKKVLDSFYIETGFEKERIIDKLKREWVNIVGNNLSIHSLPIKISEGNLLIYTDHSVFANDLSMMKNLIINKSKESVDHLRIDNLKIEVKKIKWERGDF